MAVQSNNGNEYRGSTSGGGAKKLGRALFGRHYMLKRAIRAAFIAIFVLLFIGCLFGIVNQRTTGESIADWATRTGGEIGDNIMYIFKGDEQAPLSVGTEGVYINGYEPENQQEFADVTGGGESTEQADE